MRDRDHLAHAERLVAECKNGITSTKFGYRGSLARSGGTTWPPAS
jgi:hypothetical protein